MTYYEAAERLGSRASVKLGHNTWLERRGAGAVAIRYHRTDVVTFSADGAIVYRTGGWRTATTKVRLNRFGADGVRVYQERFRWYVWDYIANVTVEFDEGMRVR